MNVSGMRTYIARSELVTQSKSKWNRSYVDLVATGTVPANCCVRCPLPATIRPRSPPRAQTIFGPQE